MTINFDALPSNAPNMLPPKGTYIALIEKAEMKQGKDGTKPPYLNLQLALRTPENKNVGKIFDIISESSHELVKFKIKRFVLSLGLDFSGISFELADVAKIAVGKQIIVDITHDEKGTSPKATVDVFKNEIYYHISEATNIFGEAVNILTPTDVEPQEESPFADESAETSEGVDY